MTPNEAAPLELIRQDPALGRLFEEVERRMKGDPGHDLAHLLRVAEWALRLGEGQLEPRRTIAAALLHDIVNVPKDSADRSKASEWSAEEARKILSKPRLPPGRRNRKSPINLDSGERKGRGAVRSALFSWVNVPGQKLLRICRNNQGLIFVRRTSRKATGATSRGPA